MEGTERRNIVKDLRDIFALPVDQVTKAKAVVNWIKENTEVLLDDELFEYIYNIVSSGSYSLMKHFKVGTVVQTKYGSNWEITEKIMSKLDLKEKDRFTPVLRPEHMLQKGVYGGNFIAGIEHEIPFEWIALAAIKGRINPYEKPDAKYNYYGVISTHDCSNEVIDPKGWFQWYCRYYLGRRSEDDERQISRWVSIKKKVSQIERNDHENQSKQRQSCLQWSYDPVQRG